MGRNAVTAAHGSRAAYCKHDAFPFTYEVVLRALEEFDISCDCRVPLLVSCALDQQSGCRERRAYRDNHNGHESCGCKPRWLPVCILDTDDGHGCPVWREGKSCDCRRMYMPRCLATGCNQRQKGKRCGCARAPSRLCPHVQEKIARFKNLTVKKAAELANTWSEQLWSLCSDEYADRLQAYSGRVTPTRDDAVNLMACRQRWGLSLWHPDDVRGLDSGLSRRLHQQAAGLKLLVSAIAPKGGAA